MKQAKTILILLLLAIPVIMAASYLFKTLDAKDGLTSSQINCILKDSHGFMWMGTPSGLYRYDGYTFKHFQCDSQDGSSLPDSYIYSLQELSNGELWIRTTTGYCIYRPQTESFERDMNMSFKRMGIDEIPSIAYIDIHKNIWCYLPKKKIICFNTQQHISTEFSIADDATSVPTGEICSISECKDGAVLVYRNGLLVCVDALHQQHIVWKEETIAQRNLRNTSSLRAFADQKDNIWLYGQGTLFVLNKKTMTWDTSIGDQLGLLNVSVDNSVNCMDADRKGNIWLATNRHGLIKINVNTHEMSTVRLSTSMGLQGEFQSTKTKSIQSVYIDNSDLLWVGTSKSGIAYWGENIYKFLSQPVGDVTAIAEDSAGHIVYGTSDQGIIGRDYQLASLGVTCMAVTSDGSLWVGSRQNGLTRIKNGVSTVYSTSSQDNKIIDDHINGMCTDGNGILWIATDGGLQNYNPRLNTFASYTKARNHLQTNNITSLCYGEGNYLYVGTSEGLSILNLSTSKIDHLTGNRTNMKRFTNNYITQVYQDSRKLIWIGTREGLNVLNMENDELDYITEKQGLCNNNICGIAEDSHKNIWVTTSNGVCRIVVDHHEGMLNYGFYNYNQSDGLQGNEFNLGSVLNTKSDSIIMGGLSGISTIRPRTEDEKAALPKIILTQLFIGEEEVNTGVIFHGRVILPLSLNESTKLTLNHDENTFTIRFSAGNYNQSERLQFHYMLKGYNDTFLPGDAQKHGVTFTDLKSGTYELHVKASSPEGNSLAQETVLQIVIEPAWWWSGYMKVFYLLVIFVIIYLWKKGFDQVIQQWNKKKAVISELIRQREEIKATSDELRQPMARMTSIIMDLSEKETTLEGREQLNNLHSQMLQVITQVSDLQLALENPEEKAKQNVRKHYELDSHGEMSLPDTVNDELTYEMRHRQEESPLSGFKVFFIDDNEELVKFISSRLRYVYDFHAFNDIANAAAEAEDVRPDLIVCKQEMPGFTGSEFCNKIKMDNRLCKMKFILMTDNELTKDDMKKMNITMSADEYLSKPFSLQEAIMRFNKALGFETNEMFSNLIEGAETRILESRNESMTTPTVTDYGSVQLNINEDDDEIKLVSLRPIRTSKPDVGNTNNGSETKNGGKSMNDIMDQNLLDNIEQYVQHNMSRGAINLEDMATAMGMSMRPFFQKVHDITGKTPADVVRDLRLKKACILLQRTNINMNDLAVNVGFPTGDYFINLFKEKFGISPTEYRLKYRR